MKRPMWQSQEPCQPYMIGVNPPVSIGRMMDRLSRFQLESLVASYAGANPESFERNLRRITSRTKD